MGQEPVETTLMAAGALRTHSYPAAVDVRSSESSPAGHATRLAELLPQGRVEWIDDARTFSLEDQPARVAELVAGVSAAIPAR